jgi:hypothetical protein
MPRNRRYDPQRSSSEGQCRVHVYISGGRCDEDGVTYLFRGKLKVQVGMTLDLVDVLGMQDDEGSRCSHDLEDTCSLSILVSIEY